MLNDGALNAEEAATMLHMGRNTVYALAKSGELPSYRLGRKLLFAPADVEAYRESQRAGGVSSASTATPSLTAGANEGLPPSISGAFSPVSTASNAAPRRLRGADDPMTIAGLGIPADMFVERLEQMGQPAQRLGLESYGALVALYEGEADAALVHLYDRRTNSYNVPFVQRLAPGAPVVVFRLVERWQGFAVAEGNPQGISSWGALLRPGIRLANRSLGCGSRVLLDEKLLSMEAHFGSIEGYGNVHPTGLAAAAAVAAGRADVAVIGEQLAAQAEGITFVPWQKEWVDLVVSKADGRRRATRLLRDMVSDNAFKGEYARIVHGDASAFGTIVYEC